jgi:hypothetical protein
MTLVERMRAGMKDPAKLAGVLESIIVLDSLAEKLASLYFGVRPDWEASLTNAALARGLDELYLTIAAVCNVHGYGDPVSITREGIARIADDDEDGRKLIHYDRLDPAQAPPLPMLMTCPNCQRTGRVVEGVSWVTYVHTADRDGDKEWPRHYCQLYHDGRRMNVVIPVQSSKEDK